MTALRQSRSDRGEATGEVGPACASRPRPPEAAVSELAGPVRLAVAAETSPTTVADSSAARAVSTFVGEYP